ncbi:neuroblast differentiation-associated protein AHNAK-like [Myxocyprinus asiaticus]|uniref:neuroblast differentiation-associated protein AHNAK-like n=1 Tax=Myxocyprinus asiaticus TaxID=70543 RepID=UPI002222EAFE|nr:neuroblast differentiation-associated protein AHNAK-like [Myxocyprinus asiaticus]
MNQTEDMQNGESEMLVKTAKEVCAEGLVVSGGGKDGIFIKEVKSESPASKHLSVKEGDQIISATVYFDNVSYEDALQILEHAQPYKVEFCLKRKPVPTRTQEDAETMRPDVTIGEEAEGEEVGEAEMRGRRKTKKQHERISWPKFPSFSKGCRANFKRSHSTSEAEEQRKLEISPPTSDTESPLKSPLKSPDGKEKKKIHKMKLKMRMTGRRSKSVEEAPENGEELTTDNMEVLEKQTFVNIAEEHNFQEPVINLVESPKLLNEADNTEPTKTRNEYTCPALPVTESLHKVELISLDNTLNTTDITVDLGEDSKERRERSELKVSIQGMDKSEIGSESQLKSASSGMRSSDPLTYGNIVGSPSLISQGEEVRHQIDSDSKLKNQEILEKTQGSEDMDMSMRKADVSLDMSDVGLIQKSPRIGSDKEKKERNILETESYGIRTRGPLAAATKSHFTKTVNRLEFASSDSFTFDIKTRQDVSSTVTDMKKSGTLTPVIFQPKPNALDVDISGKSTGSSAEVIKRSDLKIDTSELTEKANIDSILTDLGKRPESNFKLPKVDISEFDHQESIIIRQRGSTKAPLLKREEIEIPGMEDKGSKANFNSPRVKEQKAQGEAEEFNVEDVKEAVSKFPAFKLPERDITGVLVQREIKIMEIKADKTGVSPRGSPCKISSMSTDISSKLLENTLDKEKLISSFVTKDEAFILPITEQLHLHDETSITEKKIDRSKVKFEAQQSKTGKILARDDKISTSSDEKFKLPKREDIEIPGMEAIVQSVQVHKIKVAKDIQDDAVKEYTDADVTKVVKKGHEKKSKKAKVSMPSFGIMKPDIHFPDIGIELPKKTTSLKSDEIKETEAKISLDESKHKKISREEHVVIKQSAEETAFEKSHEGDVKGDQMLHHDDSTVMETPTQEVTEQVASANDGEMKAEIQSKDTNTDSSPQKKKLPKFKMAKIGGKSIKESIIKEDVTMQENDKIKVELDSEKRTSETDTKAQSFEINLSKIKMPSIDISLPKVKMPKTEEKKQEKTGLSKPEIDAGVEFSKDFIPSETPGPTKERVGKVDIEVEAVEDAQEDSGFRLIKNGISLPTEKTEESGLLPEETISSERTIIKVDGKTEVESSELPQAEIKETESKMKKRKISFPKFGFSKSEKSDAHISLPTVHSSLQKGGADITELDIQSKSTEAEAELKDSTDSPTKFKLPTIKLPKFGVSFPKAIDAGRDIQMPEAKLSGEPTALPDMKDPETILCVSKSDAELSVPEGRLEITDINIPKVDDVSCEHSFSKPEVQASLMDNEVDGEFPSVKLSKPDIKAAEVDVSLPQIDLSIPGGNVEIKEPNVNFTISKGEAEQKDITIVGSPVKFKLPSINLPKFGGKASKVDKDLPTVDIDAEEPDEGLSEEQISMKLKGDAPSGEIKESYVTIEGQCVSVGRKVEDAKPKRQEDTVNLPKFVINLSEVKAPDTDFSTSKKKRDLTSMDAKTEVQSSYDEVPTETFDKPEDDSKGPDVPVQMKRPSFSLPKFGFSKPDIKASEADLSLPKDDASELEGREESVVETKESNAEDDQTEKVSRGSPSKFKLPTITFPKFGVKFPKATVSDLDKHMPEVTKDEPTMKIKLPEADVCRELPSIPEMKSLSKPDIDVSTPEAEMFEDVHCELKKEIILSPELAFSKADVKMSLIGHGLDEEPAKEDLISGMDVQAKKFYTEVKLPSLKVDAVIPKATEKESDIKLKKLKMSFPKFGFSKSETKTPDADTSLQKEEIAVPDTEIKEIDVTILAPEVEVQEKDKITTGSPSKFKLPTISLPKFDISISKTVEESTAKVGDVTQSEIKDESEALSQNKTKLDISKEIATHYSEPSKLHFESQPMDAEIKTKDIDPGSQGSRFMMPKFEFSFPKLKGPESKKGASSMEDNIEKIEYTLTHDMKMETGVKMKTPKVLSSEHEFSIQDIKSPENNIEMGDTYVTEAVDVKQPESDMKIQMTEMLKDDTTAGGSPIKFKLPTFKLPKFGSSSSKTKPEITELRGDVLPSVAPEIDVSLGQVDSSKPEVDMEIKEQSTNIPVSKVDAEQKDVTIGNAPTNFKLPSINLPEVGENGTKEEKTMPVVDIAVKGPEVSGPDTQIKITDEALSVDIKEPHLVTEAQSVNVNIKVEDVELEGQGGKFKLPKFGIDLHKVNGSDLSTSNAGDIAAEVQETDIKEPKIKTEGKAYTSEHDSKGLDVKMALPKLGFSKPEVKTSGVDISVQKMDVPITEGSVDIETNVDIKLSKVESDQKDSNIFGSPTKYKLPSINLPKFGVKSQKTALDINVIDSEMEATNTKCSQPVVKLEVQPPKNEVQDDDTEKSANIPEVDSKGKGKVKRPSFSFPKFGFSKPDTTTPQLDVSVQKIYVPITEGTVHVTEQTAEITLPEVEEQAEQKDPTIVVSPTKFKLPAFNLPKFGVKTSKGMVNLSSAEEDIKGTEISVNVPDIKVSGKIPKIDTEEIKNEIDLSPTKRETDIHLAEGKLILPLPDVDVQDFSIEGHADIPVVDTKELDVKLKKPSFSLPKFGFSKPDIKVQEAVASHPKTDMSITEGHILVKEQDAEITFPDEMNKQKDPTCVSQTKYKLPSINLPKFGMKYTKEKSDIPTVDVDIEELEISFPETGEEQTYVDIKGHSADVDIKGKGTDIDGQGSKFKLPKFGIGMPKVKETETGLLSEEQVNVQRPDVAIEDVTTEGKADKADVDSKGLKVKLPKLGFSKPDLKSPEADVSLPKSDLDISLGITEVSEQSTDIKSPKKEIVSSPSRFKLPSINFPKFGMKASKGTVDIPTANMDIQGPEVSLPEENIKMSGEALCIDMKEPTVNVKDASIEIKFKGEGIDKQQQDGKFEIPKFGIALHKIKSPDSDQGHEETLCEVEGKIPGVVLSIENREPNVSKVSVEVDMEAKGTELEVEKSKFKVPKLGIPLQKLKGPEMDTNVSKAEVSQTEAKEAEDADADLTDMSSKGLSLKMKKPNLAFPKMGFSKSDGKAQDIQASKTTADVSLPEGSTEIQETEKDIKPPEGEIEITSPQFGSPTKFKLPTIKLPKFGVSTSKVTGEAPKADADIKETKVSLVDNEVETSKVDQSDVAAVDATSVHTKTKAKGIYQEGQDNKFKLPNFGVLLPKVKGPELEVAAVEVKTDVPEVGITEPEMKIQAEGSLPTVDIEVETELKDDKIVTGSPSKFKVPAFKMPKFGISAQKTSDIKAEAAGVNEPDTNTDLNIEDKTIQIQDSKAIHREGEIKGTTEQAAAKKVDGDKGSPSKFKLPTIKMPKMSISKTKSQDGEDDTTIKASAPEGKTEPKDDLQGPEKSPRFTMPTLGDVISGFDVEFNVPTLEEMEAQKDKPSAKQINEAEVKVEVSAEHKDKGTPEKSKFKFKFPKLGFSQSSDEGDKLVDAKVEEIEKHNEASADQKAEVNKEQPKTEKGGWFKFSRLSSPTKTAKTNEKEVIYPSKEAEKMSMNDDVEKESIEANEEPEKSPLSEIVEENISSTLSLRSSEAFADISSTQTTEQVGLSQTSPTKVKVKYAEPTATVGVSDVNRDVVTSTARCELISMEPHQPEKVNIPFSSDMSSPSVDTPKQMSEEIHFIMSNIQAIPDTQQAATLTNLDVHGIHTSPLQVKLGSDSVLTVVKTRMQHGEHTLEERHVVKETLSEETVLVTQRTRVFEGDSVEPISDETASSIRRLRDTVHTEKMKFFDSVETTEEVNDKSAEISIRYMGSSTDDNEGKLT